MRMPWPAALAGVAVVVIGAAGLVRGSMPQPAATLPSGSSASPPIVVSGAYARAPAPPTDAMAAYFTVFNTTGKADRLVSVVSGAGATAVLHATVHGKMQVTPDGIAIPPHGKVVLATGQGHVMIQKLIGTITAGQTIDLALTFEKAGTIEITAPVFALGAPAPTSASISSPAAGPSSSPSSPSTGASR
jgi:hypothetical protein